MPESLRSFIESHYVSAAGAFVKLSEVHRGYKATLTPTQATKWPRARLVSDLIAGGYRIAVDAAGVSVVTGLASTVPVAIKNGRLAAA